MGPVPVDVSRRRGRRFTSVPWAAFAGCLLIYSVDRLWDTWSIGPALRVVLYAVTTLAAVGGLFAGLRRPPEA